MGSNYSRFFLHQTTQSTASAQPVIFSGVPGGQGETDPDFYYNPLTQTLNVPVFAVATLSVTDLDVTNDETLGGDLSLTKGVDHSIGVADTTADDTVGGALFIFSADGGPSSVGVVAGNGGVLSLFSGDGGDAGATGNGGGNGGEFDITGGDGGPGNALHAAGDGGSLRFFAGDAGSAFPGHGGNGGDVFIDAGVKSENGSDGAVSLGTGNARLITIGKAANQINLLGRTALGNAALLASANAASVLLFADSGYTATTADLALWWDTSGGACVQNLPTVADAAGALLFVGKATADVNTLTIAPAGGQTINGAATLVLATSKVAVLCAPLFGGTNWLANV